MEFITLLAPLLAKVAESLFPDPVAAAAAKVQMQIALNTAAAQLQTAEAKETESQASIIRSEAAGASWSERNWRPYLMFLFMFIIANNYIVFPILHLAFPSIILLQAPEQMWTLITICVGGYVGGQSLERIATTAFSNDKFYNTLKAKLGSKISQDEVNAINAALKAGEEGV